MTTDPTFQGILALIKEFGGWGAFAGMVIFGWRAFMALAREFSSNVVNELRDIKTAIQGNELRVNQLHQQVQEMASDVKEHGRRVDSLVIQIASAQKGQTA